MASKHLGFVFPVRTEAEIKEHLAALRKEHPQAHHVCFAWRLGWDKSAHRFSDDGEPSGTAGKPIYGQILSADLTQVLVAVVRYFGGTKLGTGGLIDAYKTAAQLAIQATECVERTANDRYSIRFDYELLPAVMATIKHLQAERLGQHLGDQCQLHIAIPAQHAEHLLRQLNASGALVEFLGRE
jgi:uncharacterized YigZ family protein